MGERSDLSQEEEEASRWLVRLESPDVSLDDHRRFRAWLDASDENRNAYQALSRTWDRLDALRGIPREIKRRTIGRRTLALAGMGAVAAVFAGFLILRGSALDPPDAIYVTAAGERETVRLDDGSTVELDAGTRIVVRFAAERRDVQLQSGAALFNVAHDADRPFTVETEYGAVRVRGTSFLVKLGPANMRATIIEGRVEGRARRGGLLSGLTQNSDATPAIASANQELTFESASVSVADIAPQTAQRRLAWRDGMLAFDGETLAEAAAEVERQTGTRFTFADPALRDLRVGGYIDARDSAAFTQLLRDSLGVAAEPGADDVIVLRRAS